MRIPILEKLFDLNKSVETELIKKNQMDTMRINSNKLNCQVDKITAMHNALKEVELYGLEKAIDNLTHSLDAAKKMKNVGLVHGYEIAIKIIQDNSEASI